MTAVLNIKKFNKKDLSKKDFDYLEQHNLRDQNYQAKDNIDPERKHLDRVLIEKTKIKDLYDDPKSKSNSLLMCGFVFDFQDLPEEEKGENFNVEKHFELIQGYLEDIGLTKEYDYNASFHGSESSPHFHIDVICKSKITGTFNFNDWLNKKTGDVLMKNGKPEYEKERKGSKWVLKLDSEGNPIPKRNRINGVAELQTKWGSWLEGIKSRYTNKKDISGNLFSFPNGIYRKFSKEQKDQLDYIREAVRDRKLARAENNFSKFKKITEYIKKQALSLLDIALDIDDGIDQKKNKHIGIK